MMSSDKVVEQMAATEERHNNLQKNQCKIADAMNLMISGDAFIRGDGGVPPVIEMESLATATTAGTDLVSLMAQT